MQFSCITETKFFGKNRIFEVCQTNPFKINWSWNCVQFRAAILYHLCSFLVFGIILMYLMYEIIIENSSYTEVQGFNKK